jgi:hypothetical protein
MTAFLFFTLIVINFTLIVIKYINNINNKIIQIIEIVKKNHG